MLVKDVMNKIPLTVESDVSLHDAVLKMSGTRSSCIIVLSEKHPVGIVTERDIAMVFARYLSEAHIASEKISGFMTPNPVCVTQQTLFEDALMLSRSRNFRHLPVVNDQDELIGLVTQTNLVDAYGNLITKQTRLENSIEALKLLSLEDSLLGIGNRRAMEVDLTHSQEEAKRHNKRFAIALLDVDFFKKYNDHYGHQAGDDALRIVAQEIKNTVRDSDRVFRYGGEEILVFMPEADEEAATNCAERIRHSVEILDHPHVKSEMGKLTISGGVCSMHKGEWKEMVVHADKAMYKAKNSGRNCIRSSFDDNSLYLDEPGKYVQSLS